MQCISSLPPFPCPSIRLFHHCLDGWSAGTRCAAFHLSIGSLHPAISSARTHDRFSQSFLIAKFIHRPAIYFRAATTSDSNSSNSSDSSSCAVLGVLISRVLCTPSLQVNNFIQSTTIYPAREFCSFNFCQSISPQALSDFCNSVGFSPPSIQFGAVRLLYLGFVHKGLVANFEIFSSEVDCSVEVMFVGISRLLQVVYGHIAILSSLFQLSGSCRYQRCRIVDSLDPVGGIP